MKESNQENIKEYLKKYECTAKNMKAIFIQKISSGKIIISYVYGIILIISSNYGKISRAH